MKWITRSIYNLPKYKLNVWYNISAHIDEQKYPVIYYDDRRYIPCKVGLIVIMGETKTGKKIYYEVVKMWRTSGGDWLFDTDAINCDLKFSHIK